MGIGVDRNYDQNMSLHDWCMESGTGIIALVDAKQLPEAMFQFALKEYDRFNIPRPPMDVVHAGGWAMYHAIDTINPYTLFLAGSDVVTTNEWESHHYEIKDIHSGKTYPANPENLETFRFVPGQAHQTFQHIYAAPGLHNLPSYVGDYIEMVFQGEWGGEDYLDMISDESEEALRMMCLEGDEINHVKLKAYFQLSAWASYCWLFTSEGLEWLGQYHDIFHVAYKYGECILYEGVIIDADQYKRSERAPQSCEVCGLDAWCVDLAMFREGSRFLCEHHLNGPEPFFEEATCGSKACRHVECHHHPMHGKSDGLVETLRRTGQLNILAKENRPLITQNQSKSLLANS